MSCQVSFIGIVHQKNKNPVIIYSPSCCSKPVWHTFFCRTQNKIFWRMLVIKLTSRVWTKNTMEVNGNRKCLVTNILQNIFYYVLQKKKKTVIQGWGWDLRVSKWWQNWHFWVDYPFKTYWWFQAQKCSRKILKMKKKCEL